MSSRDLTKRENRFVEKLLKRGDEDPVSLQTDGLVSLATKIVRRFGRRTLWRRIPAKRTRTKLQP